MKKPIFHAVKRGGWSGRVLEVMAVTSESFGVCYGRTDTARTSCANRDIIARFPSLDEANAAMARIAKAREDAAPAIKAARERVRELEDDLEEAMRAAAYRVAPEPGAVYDEAEAAEVTRKFIAGELEPIPDPERARLAGNPPKARGGPAMSEPEPCQAYQVSDQMTCDVCGLTWDMNDDSPPACRKR